MLPRVGNVGRIFLSLFFSFLLHFTLLIPCRDVHAQSLTETASPVEEVESERTGLVKYHGKWMTVKEKNALFEVEIMHAQRLLDEASALYRTDSPEDIALLFKQTEQFVSNFEDGEVMDKRLEEKLLLLVGFLYVSADRSVAEMKLDLEKQTELIAFPEKHKRLEEFSREVHFPLMRLLASQMVAYVSRNGREKLDKLMVDNNLGDVLRRLK